MPWERETDIAQLRGVGARLLRTRSTERRTFVKFDAVTRMLVHSCGQYCGYPQRSYTHGWVMPEAQPQRSTSEPGGDSVV